MTQKEDLRKLIESKNRHLQILRQQEAGFGSLYVPAHILTQIEDIQAEIEKLEQELAALPDMLISRCILYVDDLKDWRLMVGGLLRDYGYQVETAESIFEAREVLRNNSLFGLAIVDVRLNESIELDESGIDFACSLRDEGYKDLPIILLTAFQPKLETVKKITRHPYKFVLLDKHDIGKHDYNDLMYQISQILPPPATVR